MNKKKPAVAAKSLSAGAKTTSSKAVAPKPSTAPTTSTGAARKSVLHNVELPVTSKKVTFHPVNSKTGTGANPAVKPWVVREPDSRDPTKKYHFPELNTALKFSNEIKQVQAGRQNDAASQKIIKKILDETNALRKERVTQQLNFNAQKSVYHNLIPINVNDSVIQMDAKRIVRRSGLEKINKDPEPNLADFLQPVPPYEFQDLRSSLKFPAETFRPPDLSNISDQIQCVHEMTDVYY